MLRLLALVLPLALDTFAVAATIGAGRPAARERWRVGLIFAAFEGGSPIVGLLAGAGAGRLIGGAADLLAIAILAGVGAFMVVEGGDDEGPRAARLSRTRGMALIALGISVSLDELALGFGLGLLVRVPVILALGLIALQAFLVSQLGLALGHRVGRRLRESAERAAGVALLLLAALFLLARLGRLPM